MDPKREDPKKNPKNEDKKPKGIWMALTATAILLLVISVVYNFISNSQYDQTDFNHFLQAWEKDNLAEVELHPDRVVYLTREEAAKPGSQQKACYTGLPQGGDMLTLAAELANAALTASSISK